MLEVISTNGNAGGSCTKLMH